jgi:beta-galactosidase/beta-glucuronidase
MILTLQGISCSHKFDSDIQNLNFYQWNLWQDTEAVPEADLPSCGWDDLHRGKGLLVRIPAPLEEHFKGDEGSAVYWYHCRFTLPEQWKETPISLVFEEAGPFLKLFLNQELVGSFQGEKNAFEVDVSDVVYYTRDNHLSIRVSTREGETSGKQSGITGTVLVRPGIGSGELKESTE